ncbi:MAG: hypothetical protein CTY33_09880 [Methylotenera sp.]|nr:MAG: hypothetical protein CTY33_09880 [Methylotenera sp.]
MIDGLWSAQFYVPPSGSAIFGSGVVIFNNGSIKGGDSTYYYTGNYRLINEQFEANVSIIHYSGPYDNILGYGVKQTDVFLSGTFDSNEFEVSGRSSSLQQPVSVRLERLSNL